MHKSVYIVILISIISLNNNIIFAQNSSIKNDSITPYTIAYEKLKKLYIKQLNSDVYQKQTVIFHKFYKKMNFDGDDSDMAPSPLPWIEKNLEKTDFFSVTEAELEWAQYMALYEEELKQNADYHDYLVEVVLKFGGEIVANVMMDVIEEYPDKFFNKDSPEELYKD